MTKHCTFILESGHQCGGYIQGGSDRCFTHDPARASDRAAARSLGGINKAVSKRKVSEEVRALLARIIELERQAERVEMIETVPTPHSGERPGPVSMSDRPGAGLRIVEPRDLDIRPEQPGSRKKAKGWQG